MSMLGIKQYRKRPLTISAVKFDPPNNTKDVAKWCDGEVVGRNGSAYIAITTPEGVMTAEKGDYIIRGIEGEFYPIKESVFDFTYEAVG